MLAKQLKAFVVHFFLPEQLRQLCHILFLRPGNDSIYPYDIISYIRTYPAVLNPNALLLAASFLYVCCPFSSESDSALKKFVEQTSKMTPEERATFLEKDEVRKH